MAYAHTNGFIHRDLKPENIMVGSFGEVHVMDWGLAKKSMPGVESQAKTGTPGGFEKAQWQSELDAPIELPGQTQVGDVMGTLSYMAPEQANGEPADMRSDVFALGGILFQILTGKPPYTSSRTLIATPEKIETINADRELVDLIRSCLSLNPQDRPLDANELNRRFESYVATRDRRFEDARLDQARMQVRLAAEKKRSRQMVRASAAVIVALLASASFGYLYLSEKNTRSANEARREREQLEQKFQHESEIRRSLASARVFAKNAAKFSKREQLDNWTLAQKELEKGVPFVDEFTDSDLLSEFRGFEDLVRFKNAVSKREQSQFTLERKCCQELFRLAEISHYPEDMQLCKSYDLLPGFAEQFRQLGIEPGLISHQALDRLTRSEFRTELIYGLMMWQRELNLRLGEPAEPAQSREWVDTYLWIGSLIDSADFGSAANKGQNTGRYR